MKCCNISPFEVSPQMKNVIAKIQNAGCLNPKNRFWKLKVTGFSFGKGGGFCISESPKGGRPKSDGQFFPNKKNNIAQAMEPNNGGRTQYLQSYWVVIHAINGMKVN